MQNKYRSKGFLGPKDIEHKKILFPRTTFRAREWFDLKKSFDPKKILVQHMFLGC